MLTPPGAIPDYICTERVRESTPGEDSSFETVEALALQLRAARSTGFEYAVRYPDDSLLSPTWLTLSAAALDGPTGRFAGIGHAAHELWEMSPAHDLGAIDGRNAFSFTNAGHGGGLVFAADTLYLGSARSNTIIPLDSASNFISADIHGESGTVGTLEFLGGGTVGAVALYGSGGRRLLTVVEGVSGNEPIRFSPNGEWLLVPGTRHTTLIETTTGRFVRLELGNAGWWPNDDSSLLVVTHDQGTATPHVFNLDSYSYTRSFPSIVLDVPLMETYPHLWFPAVSPDGSEVLLGTPAGASVEYQQEHGVGSHIARVHLESGKGRLAHPVFLDTAETLERDMREARWTGRPPARPVRLNPAVAASLTPPVTTHEYLAPGRWADSSEQVLVHTLNRAIRLVGDDADVSPVMPEILSSLKSIAGTPSWEKQEEWLQGVFRATLLMRVNGEISPPADQAWKRFGDAMVMINDGQSHLIDTRESAWT